MEYNCSRCGHKWKPRGIKRPIICPSCKSPYWHRPIKKVSKNYVLLMKDNVIAHHNLIIKTSGGEIGIRDDAGLYNACWKICITLEKQDLKPEEVAADVFEDLAKRHHFTDGNKRTAYCLAKIILIGLGYHLKIKYEGALPFILKVAEYNNTITKEEIKDWIKNNMEKIKTKKIDRYIKDLYYDLDYGKRGKGCQND